MTLTAAFPTALWLAIPALALLFVFRLLRARRRHVRVGSLLIWQRIVRCRCPRSPNASSSTSR